MRAFKIYSFKIGTKIPFSEWPGIVDKFLREQGLSYKKFFYYFEAFNDSRDKTACHKALKDCPKLGPLITNKNHSKVFLTNIGTETGAMKADLMPFMNKIYRWYGFTDTFLIYQDVNFFQRNTEHIENSAKVGMEYQPCWYHSSKIELHRDMIDVQWNGIELKIDITDGEHVLDAEPYCETMRNLLPGVKYTERLEYILSEEDYRLYAELNDSVKPLLNLAKEYIESRLPTMQSTSNYSKVSLASMLKKLCKKYDYIYGGFDYYCYNVYKRTTGGHYIVLNIITRPTVNAIDVAIGFQGIGFNHRIVHDLIGELDKEDVKKYFDKLFELLIEAETTIFPAVDSHYPTSPDWFIPEDIA